MESIISGYAYECFSFIDMKHCHFNLCTKLGAATFIQFNGFHVIHARSGKNEIVDKRLCLSLTPSFIFSPSLLPSFPLFLLFFLLPQPSFALGHQWLRPFWPSDLGLIQQALQVLGISTWIGPSYQLPLFKSMQMDYPEMSQSP